MGTNTESKAFPSFPWDELLKAIRLENRLFGWHDAWTLAQCENFNNASQNDGFKPDESELDKLIEEFE